MFYLADTFWKVEQKKDKWILSLSLAGSWTTGQRRTFSVKNNGKVNLAPTPLQMIVC